MKNERKRAKSLALADFLQAVTIAAKNLATEITNRNLSQNNQQGEKSINDKHV